MKPPSKRGGARPGSGPKPNIERLKEEARAAGIKIGEAQFWVNLAEEKALVRLQEILDTPLHEIGGRTMMTAITQVLDRALGRPKESIMHSTEDGKPLGVIVLPPTKPIDDGSSLESS